jgi:Tfp pilus assembly protein PilF
MLTRADLDTAEQYFQLALQKDPDYAAAYGGMALVWACRRQIRVTSPKEAGTQAKTAALKAVALDEDSSEAHFALADVLTWTDWNWAGADREWKRTLELEPGNADARATYSHFLMIMGRREEAMAQVERALELDPFGAAIQGFYAIDLVVARRFDDAIVQAAAPEHAG